MYRMSQPGFGPGLPNWRVIKSGLQIQEVSASNQVYLIANMINFTMSTGFVIDGLNCDTYQVVGINFSG